MAEFHASRALDEARERIEETEKGERLIPALTAIVAVLAALATLFSNHNSVSGLQGRTQAGILTTKAADQYNYYESKRIKIEINQAFAGAGLVTSPAALKRMQSRIATEDAAAHNVLKDAQAQETNAEDELEKAERSMKSYENFEVSATLFEVSIVLFSIITLMKGGKPIVLVGIGTALAGLGFFLAGLLMH